MKNLKVLLGSLVIASILTGCGSASRFSIQPDLNNAIVTNTTMQSVQSVNQNVQIPEFSRKVSGRIGTNSFAEVQRQLVKLHTYFLIRYSNGLNYYNISDTKNPHVNMLLRAERRINGEVVLDPDFDGKVSKDEVMKFITSKPYISDFRNAIVGPSFKKLDENKDTNLNKAEFDNFNSEIKDTYDTNHSVPDFNLEKELKSFDYNSNKTLTIEEYEDFFMKYLSIIYSI